MIDTVQDFLSSGFLGVKGRDMPNVTSYGPEVSALARSLCTSARPIACLKGASRLRLRALVEVVVRRRLWVASAIGSLLLLCALYCLIAPNQYEASAKVSLRQAPASSLSMEGAEPMVAASLLSAPLQLETLANVFRSDRLAWRVITDLKLYDAPGFVTGFQRRFPAFRPNAPGVDAQAYLLERFQSRLWVQSIPRTLLLEIRFRSKDAALSAAIVNALIRSYSQQEGESRVQATQQASDWLQDQLAALKTRMDQQNQRLKDFQNQHGILGVTADQADGQSGEAQHSSTLFEIDELGRQAVAVTTDRILREAQYRAALKGDPELVVAANPGLENQGGGFATSLLLQIRSRRSELQLEQSQLSAEHGPNFPRVVEINHQLEDLDHQKQAEDARLLKQFRRAWQTAADHENLVRQRLAERTTEGLKLNDSVATYSVMREEANASLGVYTRVRQRIEEARLSAGIHASSISVVDYARQPARPVTPDPRMDCAIAFFVALWLAVGGALLMESFGSSAAQLLPVLVVALLLSARALAQAPIPNTSGLPSGVVRIAPADQNRNAPSPKDAPPVWNSPAAGIEANTAPSSTQAMQPLAAPIAPGDSLDISEYHTPEFHSEVRVSQAGTVYLPMVLEVNIDGMDEQHAARVIEAALVAKGMLLHPHVSVVVTAYTGQDVSVLGEVARPGVYPFTLHHRLLDLISAASGLGPSAGRLVNVFQRSDPKTPHPVVLDPGGTDSSSDHNPELSPGDTVQVSRAGLVYVIGDVVRPGGFPVDPAQGLTVVQALSLAWGQSPNAATKALLIREQKGGRTLTTLNLHRMIRGPDPDQPIRDRDILFVPDSMAKNLWNKTLESAIQSAVGVTIYAGLVYSQRF
jgi:polysaccharide export outer membrane protein